MKLFLNLLLILWLVPINECASYRSSLVQEGLSGAAMRNAVLDFSNTSSLYKRDSVFSVSFQDTVYQMKLNELGGGKSEWVPNGFHDGIVAVGIRPTYNRFLLTESTIVGSIGKLPSRILEKEGNLFYWWDDVYALTGKTLDLFKKYDLLQDDEEGLITFPDFTIDDAQKGVHYYFCKNDLLEYKKVTTNKGMGFYEPPKINCKEKLNTD